MDGQGCWRDTLLMERLGRTITHEAVYLHAYAARAEVRAALGRSPARCNTRRRPRSFADTTPDERCFPTSQSPRRVAA